MIGSGNPLANLRGSSCSSGYFTESNNVTRESLNFEHVKCVLLGDGAVGKTSMVISYTTNGYPADYTPTTFDTFKVDVKVEDKSVHLEICDTAGQEDFDALRPLCYPQADAFLLCFSVVSPPSFANIKHKWYPELKKYGQPTTPLILVGTQSDLRDDVKVSIDLAKTGEKPVSESQALELAKAINAESYIECSALTSKNLKTVFDSALLAGMEHQSSKESRHVKQHSSSRYSTSAACKKRSQSTSSSTTASTDAATHGNIVGVKLAVSSSCTSPPFAALSERSTPKPSRINTVNAVNTLGEKTVYTHQLPSSPEPARHKLRSICCF